MSPHTPETADAIALGVLARLPGPLDSEKHRSVLVETATRVPARDGEIVRFEVGYKTGGVRRTLDWPVTAWDEFTDGSVEQLVAAIVSMIRIEIREQVATGEFDDVVGFRDGR